MKSFKEFIANKQNLIKESDDNKDWKKQFIKIEKGFVPPSKLKPIIDAFNNSNSIKLLHDVSKEIKMPKKTLYLTGGSVRDYLRNKTPKNYNLSTNATPEQVGIILSSNGFKEESEGGKKTWAQGNKDDKNKVVSIIVNVDGEKFEIETLRDEKGEFTDSIVEDSKKRDLTINSMYIELSKSDGENSKLYDPTQSGWYDISNGNIKSSGDVESKFKQDHLRAFRAIRFYCQFGKAKIDEKIKESIKKLRNETLKIPLAKIREEFLLGLMDQDIDPRKYLKAYNSTKLLEKVFPGVDLNFNFDVPHDFRNKKDKILALAWVLQDNSIEDVSLVLSSIRKIKNKDESTGWSDQEKLAVLYLLKLKEFDVNNLDDLLHERKGTGLSEEQIKNWVDMFNVEGRSTRPQWAKLVKSFAEFSPDYSQLIRWDSEEVDEDDPISRSRIIKQMNKNKLKDMFERP